MPTGAPCARKVPKGTPMETTSQKRPAANGTVKGLPEESRLSTDEGLVPWSGDVEVTSDGSESGTRRLHVIMRPIAETGGGEAARLWILEETDRNQTHARERERLVLAERAAMAAEIAHDLNNYLAGI